MVLSTENADGTANLAPISFAWTLGDVFLLGLGARGHTTVNLRVRKPAGEGEGGVEV